MKTVVVSALIAVAVITTVAVLPVSSWVFRNQVDIVANPLAGNPGGEEFTAVDLVPNWVTDARTYSGEEPSEELAHALFTSFPERNELLEAYTTKHPKDVLGWALLARLTCTLGGHTPDYPPLKDAKDIQKQTSTFSAGLKACVAGEALEPDNSYFPYLRAVFDVHLNRLQEMRSALADAASKPHYNSHIQDWAKSMEEAQVLEKGYRGELVRIAAEATLLFPDFAHMKSLARYINRHGSLKEKRDLIQIQSGVAKEGQVLIEVLVAFANVRILIRDPIPMESTNGPKLSDAEFLRLATQFDSALTAKSIAPPTMGTLETYQTLNRFVKATGPYMASLPAILPQTSGSDWAAQKLILRTISPFVALAALLLSFPFAAAAWGLSLAKSEAFRKMLPHLLCLPCWLASVPFMSRDGGQGLALAGLVFGVLQLALSFLHLVEGTASLSRIATILGGIVAVVSIAMSDHSGTIGGATYLISFGLLWKNRSGQTPKVAEWAALVAFPILMIVAGAIFTVNCMHGNLTAGFSGAALLGLCAAALFTGKSEKSAQLVACVSLLFFSTAYLVSTGMEVRGNHSERLAGFDMTNEGNTIRKLAGIH